MSLLRPYGAHSALEPAGIQAQRIEALFWRFFDVALVVFLVVAVAFAASLATKERPEQRRRELVASERSGRVRAVIAGVVCTLLTLIVLLVWSVSTGHALASLGRTDAITIDVVGHKWWWELRYPLTSGATQLTTAYELHVPVGRPIELRLASRDVIHSLWVPSLHGKRDLVPGEDTTFVFQVDQLGVYEGQCAEYCGTQHANMRLVVVAEPEESYRAWLAHQQTSARSPTTPQESRGKQLFETSRCASCHAIGGTDAYGALGPDLTHVASRGWLGMGTTPNTPEHMAAWIAQTQKLKPGVAMPSTPLDPPDLDALVAYLESLQ